MQEKNAETDPQVLKQALADALSQAAEQAPVTEDAAPVNEMPQTLAENAGEGTQKEQTEQRKERTDRFEERAMDAVAQLNADTANADVADIADIADTVRTQTEQLRYTTNPQEIMDQVIDQIKTQVKDDMTSLDMVLHPASLGHVALNLTSRDGAVTAQLTAQNENVREALQSQIQILKENLEQAGVKIEAVEVTVSSHAFEQNLEQGNDSESEAQMQERERLRRATHRINLGGSDGEGIEGIDEIGEAEAVNVAMMQADGRRLDYRG
jgi:flagellar hook-length control protein FliK